MNKKGTILFLLFLLSVLIRIPTLNRPLSNHHEFCTAISLRIMQIWDAAGIAAYHFNPVMTYPNAADKFINNYASASGKMIDADGNYYYVSHPPLAYYVPYFIFQLFGVQPDVLPIQVFNLLLHFISALGVYLICLTPPLSKEERDQRASQIAALTGFLFYLFTPAAMWFQSNIYMADMAVQPLFVFGVLAALKFLQGGKMKYLFILSLLIFFMIYTTWMGVFFAITFFFVGVFRWRKISFPLLFLFSISASALAALALIFFQYSSIAGSDAYLAEALNRFSERTGLQSGWGCSAFVSIVKNYLTGYFSLLLLLGLHFRKLTGDFFRRIALFFRISAVPVLLLHLVLRDYSGHDFTALYGSLFLSVVTGIAISYRQEKKIILFVFPIYISLSIAQYYYINRPGEFSIRGNRYADMSDRGKTISGQSLKDETIFLLNEKPSPEMIFYAGRNMLQVSNEAEAFQHLRKIHVARGVIFEKAVGEKAEVVKRLAQ